MGAAKGAEGDGSIHSQLWMEEEDRAEKPLRVGDDLTMSWLMIGCESDQCMERAPQAGPSRSKDLQVRTSWHRLSKLFLCYLWESPGQGWWEVVLWEVMGPHSIWPVKECRFCLDMMGHVMAFKQEALRVPLRRKRKFRSCSLDQNKMVQ